MSTREIITLQFGHYSNFVGAHWWNIQESSFEYDPNTSSEINHDILYREGINEKGQTTFTPRLLLVDLKGSLKSLSESGSLYSKPENKDEIKKSLVWEENKVELVEDVQSEKTQFIQDLDALPDPAELQKRKYDFEKDVTVWSDFLYTRFHPRSVNIVKEYQHLNENTPFDAFPIGSELWKSEQFQEDFSDRIRNYAEECDQFQGFQVFFDATNSFSGLATSCFDYLIDEYSKTILSFPLIPSYFSDSKYTNDAERHQAIINDSVRTLNLALAFTHLKNTCNLFVPLCTGINGWRQPGPKREFYHNIYNHELPYHSSAILASALDTLSLKYRLKSNQFNLLDLCCDLSMHDRKAAAASICLPFSFNADADLIDCLDNWEGPLSQSITPNCTIGTERVMQHLMLRGIPENRLKKPEVSAGKQKDLPAYKMKSVKEMMEFYLSCTTFATASNVTISYKGMPVKTPYPQFFDKFVGCDGNIHAKERTSCVESVPILAGLHNTTGIGNMLESLHTEARKIKFPRFHQFINAGIEVDEFNECLDNLFDFRENYEDNYLI